MPGKILIADPIAANRIVLKAMLLAEYFEVFVCEDIANLEDNIILYRPDIIILPDTVEGRNGYDLCQVIKASSSGEHIPVILTTCSLDQIDWPRALTSFLDEVILLPVGRADLIRNIRRLLRQKQEIDGLRSHIIAANPVGFAEDCKGTFLPQSKPLQVGYITGDKHCQLNLQIDHLNISLILDPQSEDISRFEVIILDESCEQLQNLHMLRKQVDINNIPIICLSSSASDKTHKKLLELGANSIVFKSNHPNQIALHIHSVVHFHHQKKGLSKRFQNLIKQANLDPLTGLYNRRYADQYLSSIIENTTRIKRPFAVLMLDIDNFKNVNDKYGHMAGDAVLLELSKRLSSDLREMDLLARVGGEEFLIVLPDTNNVQCLEIAERIRKNIAKNPMQPCAKTPSVNITISMGAAISETTEFTKNSLLQKADNALYRAKTDGRNCVRL